MRAYKGLLKEKEALEASLKALSVQQLEDGVKNGKSNNDIKVDEPDQEGAVERSKIERQHLTVCHTVSDIEQVNCAYIKLSHIVQVRVGALNVL